MQPLIVVDENIPGWRCFERLGRVRRLPGRAISAADLGQADMLIVRSVTRVDAGLLDGSQVRFVGTATIGTDHLDTGWLDAQGIPWASAPGCNAHAVVDYVCSAIAAMPGMVPRLLQGGRVGIVGYGNVGRRLHQRLAAVGIECRAFDPLLSPAQCPIQTSLAAVTQVDVLCLHAPLTRFGPHPSWHLVGAGQLAGLPSETALLNAGRGAVLDNRALLDSLHRHPRSVVLDVWENEPAIDRALLDAVTLGTPHIAGYSQEGKLAGTAAVYRACCDFLGVEPEALPALPPAGELQVGDGSVERALLSAYDIREDDRRLRAAVARDASGVAFDHLRKTYPERREYSAWCLPAGLPDSLLSSLQAWGFGR